MESCGKVKKLLTIAAQLNTFSKGGLENTEVGILTEAQRSADGGYWCATMCIGWPWHKVAMGAQPLSTVSIRVLCHRCINKGVYPCIWLFILG